MSVRSFMGAEIQAIASEFAALSRSSSLVRDTSIKKNGIASWNLNSSQSHFFETAKTKAATDVVAGCMFWLRTSFSASGRVHRFLTAGDHGGNVGRYYFALDAKIIKLYDQGGVLRGTGSTLTVSTFHHIVVIDDGTNVRLYLDGSTSAEITWAHGQGAWNNLSWGPACVQSSGKAINANHWFDDVICFDDQDGRMDKITPADWDGDTSWRVERSVPISDVVTDYTPSAGGAHYLLVDDEPDSTLDYVATPISPWEQHHIVREGGTDYDLSTTALGFTYDTSPAGDPWTDTLWNSLSTGQRDGAGNKELLEVETAAAIGVSGVGSERIRAARFLQNFQSPSTPKEFYVWRDTVLIGPPDPAPPATAFIPRVMQY